LAVSSFSCGSLRRSAHDFFSQSCTSVHNILQILIPFGICQGRRLFAFAAFLDFLEGPRTRRSNVNTKQFSFQRRREGMNLKEIILCVSSIVDIELCRSGKTRLQTESDYSRDLGHT
jgi:hypothetical protein